MSTQDDYDSFFQSATTVENQQRRAQKSSNTRGEPINLESKISALHLDPADNASSRIFVAAATGVLRQIDVGDGKTSKPKIILNAGAPLTSLAAVLSPAGNGSIVFAGSWDKNIYSATVEDGQSRSPKVFRGGHADFVKCVAAHTTALSSAAVVTLLFSGSSDRSIAVWDAGTGKLLLQLRNHHGTSINAILVDPVGSDEAPDRVSLFSASSDGQLRRTTFRLSGAGESVAVSMAENAVLPSAHPTSVYALALCGYDEDLLTASADGTAAVLSRHRDWEAETRLEHGAHVRCAAASADGSRIVTGGRDEDLRIWDASEQKLLAVVDGHYDEVMAVQWVRPAARGGPVVVVSGSLDGTVRRWEVQAEIERTEKGGEEEEAVVEEVSKGPALTAEEEAELAELMEDDD